MSKKSAGKVTTPIGQFVDPKQQGFQKQDKWKDELREAYDTMAKRQTEASDKQYDQAKTSADLHAASRGMGRSSYNNQVLAGLDSDKVKAQNTIRENVDAAYAQAVQQRENEIWQQHFQEQQAAQQQANWQAQFDAQQAQQAWQNQFQQDQFNAQQAAAAAASASASAANTSYNPGSQDQKKDEEEEKPKTWLDILNGFGSATQTFGQNVLNFLGFKS